MQLYLMPVLSENLKKWKGITVILQDRSFGINNNGLLCSITIMGYDPNSPCFIRYLSDYSIVSYRLQNIYKG